MDAVYSVAMPFDPKEWDNNTLHEAALRFAGQLLDSLHNRILSLRRDRNFSDWYNNFSDDNFDKIENCFRHVVCFVTEILRIRYQVNDLVLTNY